MTPTHGRRSPGAPGGPAEDRAAPADLPAANSRGERALRSLRRLAGALVAFFVLVTAGCLVGNALTRPAARIDPGFGDFVTVDGLRVHYQRWGTSGTPIVLVHAIAENSIVWGPVAQRLASQHVVYALDLAGYGYTDYDDHYTLADEAALVYGFIRVLGLNRPALVGHSLAAAVVGQVALDHPAAVAGVIFADGDALPFGTGNQRTVPDWLMRSPYVISAYRLATRWRWASNRLVRAQCGTRCLGVTPDLVEQWMRPLRQGDAENALLTIAAAGVLHLTPQQIRSIKVPRGIIWGAEDTSVVDLQATRINLGHPPEVVLPGAAHLSMVADPDAFATGLEHILAAW